LRWYRANDWATTARDEIYEDILAKGWSEKMVRARVSAAAARHPCRRNSDELCANWAFLNVVCATMVRQKAFKQAYEIDTLDASCLVRQAVARTAVAPPLAVSSL
jgi:hypothetical protein